MEQINKWLENFPIIQVGASVLALIVFTIIRKVSTRRVLRRANLESFDQTRSNFIKRVARIGTTFFLIVALGIIWEVSLEGLSVYIASFLTIVGVGLFATWSIVSNITASVILFFFFPFKIGSRVKIMDGDNSAEGEVLGLSLFSITIKKSDGSTIYFPNNLAIQKSIVHLK